MNNGSTDGRHEFHKLARSNRAVGHGLEQGLGFCDCRGMALMGWAGGPERFYIAQGLAQGLLIEVDKATWTKAVQVNKRQ